MFRIGKIINTHGIKGEVKIKQITDFIERFHIGEAVYYYDENKTAVPLVIKTFRVHKGFILIQFNEFHSVNDVEFLKGESLYIKEEQLTELTEGEYYYHEIIGCEMYTTTNEKIGIIDTVLSPGANDVWVVKDENGKEHLIPYIDDVVKEVDIAAKKVVIEVMEGLLE